MDYVCEARDGKTWFRIETEMEADQESELMDHAVAKHFRREQEKAVASYQPTSTVFIEQNIGLKAHIQRAMPLFLTLRDNDGDGLATAMLPPGGQSAPNFKIIIVGKGNRDPYVGDSAAIETLGKHYGMTLRREDCYPYNR
ncbi:MAG: hypothetical protein OXT01_21600 [Rhodospirillaceae bacterium]|nr:hypothetical protein [Rhodospirillaceae bacterium]